MKSIIPSQNVCLFVLFYMYIQGHSTLVHVTKWSCTLHGTLAMHYDFNGNAFNSSVCVAMFLPKPQVSCSEKSHRQH
jgi:hypothetical protein